jgi:hypothetical protein
MIIPERWLLDTNIWVFGLRGDTNFSACGFLLERIGAISIVIPLQLLKELNLNLSEEEMRDFYELINQHPEVIEVSWEPAPVDRVKFFESKVVVKEMQLSLLMPKHLELESLSVKTASSFRH